jgi:hypothetical protein
MPASISHLRCLDRHNHDGDNPNLASALLHHTHPIVTTAHYNRATSLTAADMLWQIVRRYEKNELGGLHQSHRRQISNG